MLLTLGVLVIIFVLFCCLVAVLSRINEAEPPVAQHNNSGSTSTDPNAVLPSSLSPTV